MLIFYHARDMPWIFYTQNNPNLYKNNSLQKGIAL